MIGQQKILSNVNELSRFTIITGAKGQGKKTLVKEIAKKLNYTLIIVNTKIDDIRQMIEVAYKQIQPTIYLIPDADDMSLGAKNSLLKILEEPPQQAYFIMTLQQIENTLQTIKSRAIEIRMQLYSYDELEEMINKLLPNATKQEKTILHIFQNYWQIEKVIKYKPVEFFDYVALVYNNIYKVQSANSFKLAEKLDLKNTEEGYDLELFFIMYLWCCGDDLFKDKKSWFEPQTQIANVIDITVKYKNKLAIKSINKQMLLDMWILDTRKEWLKL